MQTLTWMNLGPGMPVPIQSSVRAMLRTGRQLAAKEIEKESGHTVDAIGFGLVDRVAPESLGTGPVDLMFKLKLGVFRGRRQVEAHLLDVRRSDPKRSPENRSLAAG